MQPEETQQELSEFNNSPPARPHEEANKNAPTNKPKKSSKNKAASSAFSFFQQQSQPKSQQQFPGGVNFQAFQQLANNMQPKLPASMFQQFPSGLNPMSFAAGASSNPWTNIIAQQQFQPKSSGSFQQQFSGFNNRINSQKPSSKSKPSSASKLNQRKSQQASASANTDYYQNAAMPDFFQSMMSSMMNQ